MKKRYVGVIHLTPEGDGVIEILGEEEKSSLRVIEHRSHAMTVVGPS